MSVGSYTNQMNYMIKENMRLSTNFTLASPMNGTNPYSKNGFGGSQLFYGANLDYQPTKNLFVKPINIAVNRPSKDDSVLISLFTSFNEKEEPRNFEIYSSSFFSIDKNTGSKINRKITKQPEIIVIEVFNFILVK